MIIIKILITKLSFCDRNCWKCWRQRVDWKGDVFKSHETTDYYYKDYGWDDNVGSCLPDSV